MYRSRVFFIAKLTDYVFIVSEWIGKQVFMEIDPIKTKFKYVEILDSFLSEGSSNFYDSVLTIVEDSGDKGNLILKPGPQLSFFSQN